MVICLLLRPTHTGRDLAMRRDFLVFTSRQICSLDNFIENFITFPLLDSLLFISAKVFYCRPIYLLLKNEKSRRVAKSRPVCVGPLVLCCMTVFSEVVINKIKCAM